MSDREKLLSSPLCGCFYCLEKFTPDKIEEWVDPDEASGLGQTAICPYCGIDSVIGFDTDFAEIKDFLITRNKAAFS